MMTFLFWFLFQVNSLQAEVAQASLPAGGGGSASGQSDYGYGRVSKQKQDDLKQKRTTTGYPKGDGEHHYDIYYSDGTPLTDEDKKAFKSTTIADGKKFEGDDEATLDKLSIYEKKKILPGLELISILSAQNRQRASAVRMLKLAESQTSDSNKTSAYAQDDDKKTKSDNALVSSELYDKTIKNDSLKAAYKKRKAMVGPCAYRQEPKSMKVSSRTPNSTEQKRAQKGGVLCRDEHFNNAVNKGSGREQLSIDA